MQRSGVHRQKQGAEGCTDKPRPPHGRQCRLAEPHSIAGQLPRPSGPHPCWCRMTPAALLAPCAKMQLRWTILDSFDAGRGCPGRFCTLTWLVHPSATYCVGILHVMTTCRYGLTRIQKGHSDVRGRQRWQLARRKTVGGAGGNLQRKSSCSRMSAARLRLRWFRHCRWHHLRSRPASHQARQMLRYVSRSPSAAANLQSNCIL